MRKCFYCSCNENHFKMNEVKIINDAGITESIYFCDEDYKQLEFTKDNKVKIDSNISFKLT